MFVCKQMTLLHRAGIPAVNIGVALATILIAVKSSHEMDSKQNMLADSGNNYNLELKHLD